MSDLLEIARKAAAGSCGEPVSREDADSRESRADFDERRERVLAMLRATAVHRIAVLVENPDTDPVSVVIALREPDRFLSFEMLIPRDSYDGFKFLELVRKHSGQEIAVIEGGKTPRRQVTEPEAA